MIRLGPVIKAYVGLTAILMLAAFSTGGSEGLLWITIFQTLAAVILYLGLRPWIVRVK